MSSVAMIALTYLFLLQMSVVISILTFPKKDSDHPCAGKEDYAIEIVVTGNSYPPKIVPYIMGLHESRTKTNILMYCKRGQYGGFVVFDQPGNYGDKLEVPGVHIMCSDNNGTLGTYTIHREVKLDEAFPLKKFGAATKKEMDKKEGEDNIIEKPCFNVICAGGEMFFQHCAISKDTGKPSLMNLLGFKSKMGKKLKGRLNGRPEGGDSTGTPSKHPLFKMMSFKKKSFGTKPTHRPESQPTNAAMDTGSTVTPSLFVNTLTKLAEARKKLVRKKVSRARKSRRRPKRPRRKGRSVTEENKAALKENKTALEEGNSV